MIGLDRWASAPAALDDEPTASARVITPRRERPAAVQERDPMFRAILCAFAVAMGVGAIVSHPTSAEIIAAPTASASLTAEG